MTTLLTSAEKNRLIAALALAMFLAAVEGTIVTLAIPTIVGDLQGFDLISHVFSLYLLTGALATPIYGKLSDLYGRKRMLMVGIVIFLVGSVLCGFAQDMVSLIIFRAVQGIGAGAIYLVPMIIVGDVFPLNERGKVQGMLSMVWGVAGLLGPFLGGLLIDLLSWHWIFFINIPFGLLTIVILQTSFTEDFHRQRHHIDFPGIVTLTLAMLAFLAIFVFADEGATLLTARNAVLLAVSVLLLFVFYRIERRSPEPIVPFDVLTKSSVFVNIVALLLMAVIFAFDVYTPLYLQNVRGLTPLFAGLALLASSVSWMLVSIPLGKLMLRFGGKPLNAIGMGATFLLLLPLLLLTQDSPIIFIVVVAFLFGIGPGIAMTTQTMIIQNSVGFEKRGAAVAVNSLVRTLGQTIGISVFGALFNARIIQGFEEGGITQYDLGNLYDLAAYQEGVSWDQIVAVLLDSVHVVYFALIVIAALGVVLSLIMPRPALSAEVPGAAPTPQTDADASE
ncbi:MAG: MFS transporter [Coriobacteriales bacterium]|jgi:EmrB/QacA subfamily drug resistance transporter|nr:MFS transporter [Coriobacteriales bacterium]